MPMIELPDPRAIDSSPCPAPLRAMLQSTTEGAHEAGHLADVMRGLLASGDESQLRTLLAWHGPAWFNRAVRRAAQTALDGDRDAALRLQLFALPVVLVAGSRAPTVLPMVLSETEFLHGLFADAGALGPARELAFSAALCDAQALESLPLVEAYRCARLDPAAWPQSAPAGAPPAGSPLALPAAPLSLAGGQQVDLRFLVGTNLVPRGAPAFTETAGDAARWGAALTRELAARLSLPGVTLLPLVRAPRPLLAALTSGTFCREEVACQLGVGDHLRDMRARHGDVSANLRVGGRDQVCVELRSVWEPAPRSHCWQLDPYVALSDVTDSIAAFLADCGVPDLRAGMSGGAGAAH